MLAALPLKPGMSLHLRELAKLAQSRLLLRSDQGNQARYSANVQHLLFPELAAMFRKTHGMVATLRVALAPLLPQTSLACVYGSVASGTAMSMCCWWERLTSAPLVPPQATMPMSGCATHAHAGGARAAIECACRMGG